MKEFEIGDKVIYTLDGKKYKIIATIDTPYRITINGIVYDKKFEVNNGYDYMLAIIDVTIGKIDDVIHATKNQIEIFKD